MHLQHPHGFAPPPGGGGGGLGAGTARVAMGEREGETEDMWNEFSVEASRGHDEDEPNLVCGYGCVTCVCLCLCLCLCVCVILDPSHLTSLRPSRWPRLHISTSPTPAPPTHASRFHAALSDVLRGAERVHYVDSLSHDS